MSVEDSQMDRHTTIATEMPPEDEMPTPKKDISSVIVQEGILIEDSQ